MGTVHYIDQTRGDFLVVFLRIILQRQRRRRQISRSLYIFFRSFLPLLLIFSSLLIRYRPTVDTGQFFSTRDHVTVATNDWNADCRTLGLTSDQQTPNNWGVIRNRRPSDRVSADKYSVQYRLALGNRCSALFDRYSVLSS